MSHRSVTEGSSLFPRPRYCISISIFAQSTFQFGLKGAGGSRIATRFFRCISSFISAFSFFSAAMRP